MGKQSVVWLTPKAILEDVLHPAGQSEQRFILVDRDLAWRIAFPPEGYAYAGFTLRRTNDLAAIRPRASLHLRFRPGYEASRYRVALIDGHGVLVDVPLLPKPTGGETGWLSLALPLASFPDRGLLVREGQVKTGVTFDWSKVREFRLIGSGRRSVRHIEVGLLRIVEE